MKIAKNLEEACELAKAGLEYFTTIDSIQVFKKRKGDSFIGKANIFLEQGLL